MSMKAPKVKEDREGLEQFEDYDYFKTIISTSNDDGDIPKIIELFCFLLLVFSISFCVLAVFAFFAI